MTSTDGREEQPVTAQYRIEVTDDCIVSGSCLGIAPQHFVEGAERTEPRSEIVDASEDVLDAANCCPMEAIRVYDAQTGQLLAGGA